MGWCCVRPREIPSKLAVGLDSKVALGAIARGRSGSQSLNRELRRLLPWILGKNLHVGGFHMPTWAIRADEVSRFYELRPPRCPLPSWLLQVAAHGPSQATDDLLEKRSWTPKSWGRWLLLGSVVLARVRADDPLGDAPSRCPRRTARDPNSKEAG